MEPWTVLTVIYWIFNISMEHGLAMEPCTFLTVIFWNIDTIMKPCTNQTPISNYPSSSWYPIIEELLWPLEALLWIWLHHRRLQGKCIICSHIEMNFEWAICEGGMTSYIVLHYLCPGSVSPYPHQSTCHSSQCPHRGTSVQNPQVSANWGYVNPWSGSTKSFHGKVLAINDTVQLWKVPPSTNLLGHYCHSSEICGHAITSATYWSAVV